jgi:hypothetical protein
MMMYGMRGDMQKTLCVYGIVPIIHRGRIVINGAGFSVIAGSAGIGVLMKWTLNSQKTQNLLYSSIYNQTLPRGQQLSGCSGLFFGNDSLPLALILPV